MTRNNDYTTGNFLHYVLIYEEKQIQVFLNKLNSEENQKKIWCNNVFVAGKQQKSILNFSLDSLIVTEQYKQQNINKFKYMKSAK